MINTTELAKRLGKHPNTIRNWIKKGLPNIKTEKDFMFDYNEVIQWLKERSV